LTGPGVVRGFRRRVDNAGADLSGDAVQFVVEDVAESLGEDQREDEVLELRRFLRAADAARGVPDPGFERASDVGAKLVRRVAAGLAGECRRASVALTARGRERAVETG
jgi:hypothetical protein